MKDHKKQNKTAAKPSAPLFPRPDIYEFSPENRQSKRLVKDGYLPIVSQDGQWIAFFGSEHPEQPYPLQVGWEDAPSNGTSLCVIRRDGTGRKALNRVRGFYPYLCWRPNGYDLLTIQQVRMSPDAQAQVDEWDIRSGQRRSVASLPAKDFKQFPESVVDPKFRPLQFSPDGNTLFVAVTELLGLEPSNVFTTGIIRVQSIDLDTGANQTIATLREVSGMDFLDGPAATNRSNQANTP